MLKERRIVLAELVNLAGMANKRAVDQACKPQADTSERRYWRVEHLLYRRTRRVVNRLYWATMFCTKRDFLSTGIGPEI